VEIFQTLIACNCELCTYSVTQGTVTSLFMKLLKFTSHLLTTLTLHHTFTVSFQAPTWNAFSDYTGPDLLCSTVFHLSYFVFSF